MQVYRRTLRLCAIASLLTLGACATSPLDLIAPADLALMKTDRDVPSAGPVSVDEMLARIRDSQDSGTPEPTSPVRAEDATHSEGAPEPAAQITLEELRRQVAARESVSAEQGCK